MKTGQVQVNAYSLACHFDGMTEEIFVGKTGFCRDNFCL